MEHKVFQFMNELVALRNDIKKNIEFNQALLERAERLIDHAPQRRVRIPHRAMMKREFAELMGVPRADLYRFLAPYQDELQARFNVSRRAKRLPIKAVEFLCMNLDVDEEELE